MSRRPRLGNVDKVRWAAFSATYRYLSFEQGGSAVVKHMSLGGPMLMANFSF